MGDQLPLFWVTADGVAAAHRVITDNSRGDQRGMPLPSGQSSQSFKVPWKQGLWSLVTVVTGPCDHVVEACL